MNTQKIVELLISKGVINKADDIINRLPQSEQDFLHTVIRLVALVGMFLGVFIGVLLSILIWVVL